MTQMILTTATERSTRAAPSRCNSKASRKSITILRLHEAMRSSCRLSWPRLRGISRLRTVCSCKRTCVSIRFRSCGACTRASCNRKGARRGTARRAARGTWQQPMCIRSARWGCLSPTQTGETYVHSRLGNVCAREARLGETVYKVPPPMPNPMECQVSVLELQRQRYRSAAFRGSTLPRLRFSEHVHCFGWRTRPLNPTSFWCVSPTVGIYHLAFGPARQLSRPLVSFAVLRRQFPRAAGCTNGVC